jgi:hypothetical protein
MLTKESEAIYYYFENDWTLTKHGHPSGLSFWIAEKIGESHSFEHPLSETRIFRDKANAFNYIKENSSE